MSDPELDDLPPDARAIRRLLDRNELPRRQHSPHVASVLGLSYAQAHRKAVGGAEFKVRELEMLAASVGESLHDLFDPWHDAEHYDGLLVSGSSRLRCRVWPGSDPVAPGDLTCTRTSTGWRVSFYDEGSVTEQRSVRRLLVLPTRSAPRVAVLDDDPDVVAGIRDYLSSSGYEVAGFSNLKSIRTGLADGPFDAYIFDWLVGDVSVLDTVELIRARQPAVPIAIVSGKVDEGVVPGDAFLDATERLGLRYFTKPVGMRSLLVWLDRAFRSA